MNLTGFVNAIIRPGTPQAAVILLTLEFFLSIRRSSQDFAGNTNILGTVFGAIVIGLTSNGLNLLGVETNYQIIAKGLLILFALILDSVSAKFYAQMRKKQVLASMTNSKEMQAYFILRMNYLYKKLILREP
ncbi:MAG: hypothetical protein LBO80_09700 [Treponema sp.]|jgi:hypothetical protein|nr:hypothetical protein [Treponema sp.]